MVQQFAYVHGERGVLLILRRKLQGLFFLLGNLSHKRTSLALRNLLLFG